MFYQPPEDRPDTAQHRARFSHGSGPPGIREYGPSLHQDQSDPNREYPWPWSDCGSHGCVFSRAGQPSSQDNPEPQTLLPTSETSSSAFSVQTGIFRVRPWACQIRRSCVPTPQIHHRCHPGHPVLSGLPSFVRSDNTHVGSAPSASSRDLADVFPFSSSQLLTR